MIPVDWIWGLVGGLMIGCAGAIYLLINGRVMGASGIVGGLIDGTGRTLERLAFVAGLVGVPALIVVVQGGATTNATTSIPVLVVAGLLVGFGTRMANGCTSGHGVCGISRFSVRGIAATVSFLIAGALSMFVLRHLLGVI